VDGNSVWSMMWDEVSVASLLDESVIKTWERLYMDVVIDHGPRYGHTLVWRQPPSMPTFFLPYSGPEPLDPDSWRDHLEPPYNRHPSRVQMAIDVEKFESLFVSLLSR
ncbi:MAG: hypothetical protein ACE5JI_21635, partial [Acidobacteriota bacterium]